MPRRSGPSSKGSPSELQALRGSVPPDPVPIRGLVALLIAYLTLPAVAALVAGLLTLRAQRAADEAPPA